MRRIAVFGLGSIGQRHVKNLLEMGETDVLGCDVRTGDEGFMPDLPITITSAASMVWDWKPDVVLVCVPPAGHHGLVLQALAHNCSVFCEKPLAISHEKAIDLVRYNDGKNVLAVGYQLLACPSVQAFTKDWKQLYIWDKQDMGAWPKGTYLRDLLLDFSHEISLALFWAGSMPEVANIRWIDSAKSAITLSWPDGRVATIDLSGNYQGYERGATSNSGEWLFNKEENDLAYRRELEAFLLGEPYCTGEDALNVMRVLEMLR